MKTNNLSKKVKSAFLLVAWAAALALTSPQSAQADTWTQKTDMPTPRNLVHTHLVDGKIYAIGAQQGSLTKVEAYDPATDTWATKAAMPTARTFMATCVENGIIYAIGGAANASGQPNFARVEAYDPVTDTWDQLTKERSLHLVQVIPIVPGQDGQPGRPASCKLPLHSTQRSSLQRRPAPGPGHQKPSRMELTRAPALVGS